MNVGFVLFQGREFIDLYTPPPNCQLMFREAEEVDFMDTVSNITYFRYCCLIEKNMKGLAKGYVEVTKTIKLLNVFNNVFLFKTRSSLKRMGKLSSTRNSIKHICKSFTKSCSLIIVNSRLNSDGRNSFKAVRTSSFLTLISLMFLLLNIKCYSLFSS